MFGIFNHWQGKYVVGIDWILMFRGAKKMYKNELSCPFGTILYCPMNFVVKGFIDFVIAITLDLAR